MNTTWKFPRFDVAQECRSLGNFLHLGGCVGLKGEPLDGPQVMWAFALQESFHEPAQRDPDFFVCPPRFEIAYYAGKYSHDARQAELNRMFGQDGAKSYSPWQVMLVNVPGFKPEEFRHIEICAQAFLMHCNAILDHQKPPNITDLADAYNSGNWKDGNIPDEYKKRVTEFYYQIPVPPPGPTQ